MTINLAKYEGYPGLIKRLIRGMYLAYEPTTVKTQEKTADQLKFENDFKLLYDRTFHEIVHNRFLNAKKEVKTSRESEFDLKKAIPILVTLLTTTNVTFNLIGSKFFGYLLFVLSLIWTCLSVFKINLSAIRAPIQMKLSESLCMMTISQNTI